ncbi:MAG TPA: DedA family protein [Candidatus Micrarchaeia archaeon]|nr:DedA family protein [Candidatus Micrarchaeia archaeon]
MVHAVLHVLLTLPAVGVYGFTFAWLAAESAGLPLPDELVLLFLGYLAHRGTVSLGILIVCSVSGAALGAAVSYSIGRWLGPVVLDRTPLGRRVSRAQLAEAQRRMARRGALAVYVSRVLPIARNIASYAAGIAQIPPRAFYPAMLLGSLTWCSAVLVAGNQLGAHYRALLNRAGTPLLIASVALVVALAVAAVWWWRRRGRQQAVALAGGGDEPRV